MAMHIERDPALDHCIRQVALAITAIRAVAEPEAERNTNAMLVLMEDWVRRRVERKIRVAVNGEIDLSSLMDLVNSYQSVALDEKDE